MDEKIKKKIDDEISRINENFESHSFLFDLSKLDKEPDLEFKDSASLFIHSFYNGIENIAKIIFKHTGEEISNDSQWHKILFNKLFESTEKRPELLNIEYKEQLQKYLFLRHIIRHTYSYIIDWKKVKPLLKDINELWEKIKNDINNFVKKCDLQNQHTSNH